ncbi:hypothetical protein P43SY_006541 [Pythium insidiosum]|uniref:C2 domain-containing protein n=1 Tax=Pythium insidiosum TaxID=114742 RepID=A0AAD5LY38_PYTIN|nr:hypothetical protein P43SY_006541 [Pythium insidiosum]
MGVITATGLAVFSDVAAAYLRYREAQFSQDKKAPLEQVAWLKVGFSYIGVGYVITGNWRNLYWFLNGLGYFTTQTGDYVGLPDPRYSLTRNISKFSCLGGRRNCPDGGEYVAAGGNLTLTVVEMRNLPDTDGFGLAARKTDAYLEASIGDNVRRSATIENSLNPVWPPCSSPGCKAKNDTVRDLSFGFRPAGTTIKIRIMDEDGGFEFGDDLIAEFTVNAIYCSAFTAKVQSVPTPDNSVWAMPQQPLCVEEMWIPLVSSGERCIKTEETFVQGLTVNGGMGGYFPDEESWLYGRPFSTSGTQMASYFRMDRSKGGLLIRSDRTLNNHKGNTTLAARYGYPPLARVSFNFDADVFVFRRVDDAASQPEWLNTSFGWSETREYAQLVGVVGDFQAVTQRFKAHPKNQYGDALGLGIITGPNVAQDYKDNTLSMYLIIAQPLETFDVVPATYSKDIDRVAFGNVFLQFAPTFFLLLTMVVKFLRRMNWRLERVESYLAEKVVEQEDPQRQRQQQDKDKPRNAKPAVSSQVNAKKSVWGKSKPAAASPSPASKSLHSGQDMVASLFLCYKQSHLNAEFRHNFFYATAAIYVVIASPLLMLVSWGVTSILIVTPPAFGFGLIFLGLGTMAAVYGTIRWVRMGWRMTNAVLATYVTAFTCAFVFLFAATFADPRVFVGGEHLDFFALSCIFLTLNMMPMLWIAFTNDAKLAKSLTQVIAVVAASKKVNVLKSKFKNLGTMGLKFAAAKSDGDAAHVDGTHGRGSIAAVQRRARKESVFAPLMGDHYTIEPSIPGFSRADILQSAFVTPPEKKREANRRYYLYALAVLAVYCIVAFARTAYPAQSIGISVTVLLIDACIYMLYRGHLSWSAGYTVFLMSSIRVCLAATSGEYWILGHAFLYMVFGTALCREIIGKNLPRMSKHEAGGITFFGHDHFQWRHLDMSTTPEFVLGVLSFFYVFLLLAVAFGTDANQTIRVPVLGQEWPLWVFGVLAFIVVLFTGLSLATSRAFFLMKEQLLSDYAAQAYLFVRPFKLPFMLAAASEVLVICSGLFVFASTQSSFILVTSVFGPLLLMLSLAVYVQWRKNDYRLVIWPPEDDEEDVLDDDDDDLDEDAAREKEAEILRETFVLPPLKGKSNTTFFDGNDETFKMPSLPSKTALQAKFLPKLKAAEQNDGAAGDAATRKPQGLLARVGRKAMAGAAASSSAASAAQSPTNGKLPIVPGATLPALPEQAEASASALTLATTSKPSSHRGSSALAVVKDWWRGRLRLRELFSRATWRKYREGGPTSAPDSAGRTTNGDLSPTGSTRPLLASTALTRKSSAYLASSASAGDPLLAGADIDLAKLTVYQAFRQGLLLPQDYVTLGCFALLLGLLFVYGAILTITERPHWFGQLIWVGAYVLIFTLFPTVKYFQIAGTSDDMRLAFGASYLLAWITGLILFAAVLHADVNQIESLVILSILVFYPIMLLFIVTLLKWRDEGWAITRPVRRILSSCFAAIVLWIFEMYIFAGLLWGGVLTFLAALFLFILFFLVKWIENDMYLAPSYQRRANLVIANATVGAIAVGLFTGLSFFFCLSIVFIVLLLKYLLHFVAAWFVAREDTALFFSPYVFPVFSYNAYTNNVVDENRNVRYIYVLLLLAFAWGVSGVMFFDPLAFGIGLSSLALLSFAGITAHLCAVTPVRLGIAAKYVNEIILKDASTAAKQVSEQRRRPFTLESKEFIELERRERKAELEFQAIAYGGAFAKKKTQAAQDDVVAEEAAPPPRRSSGEIAMEIDAVERSCRFRAGVDGHDERLTDGLLTVREVWREILDHGVGPFGFLYILTLPWRAYKYLRWRYFPSAQDRAAAAERLHRSEQDELDELERGALRLAFVPGSEPVTDLVGLLLELPVLDEELDREFYEETRCVIHLQLLMMNAADARLSREKILFQKFLRENRFKLMSNGINPPANIFKTSSFASIDIPLVAVWLTSLTPEERARFHALKAAFNDEMERTDAIIDAEDQQTRLEQQQLREAWRPHEDAQCRKRMHEFHARRLRREAEGVSADELAQQDEALVNAQEALMEIESGYSCVPGDVGRALQFVDREFPPDETSVANVSCAGELAGWQVSTAINVVAGLFDGGTDPDDVRLGRLNDSWLLSAISIIAASGGVDDGKVDALIDRLFITKQTSLTGAYALRLFKNAQWETVIVDDFFPVLADPAAKTTPSAGAAFAHSPDFEELWVPLVEKAFAKYYGGYAALEHGYVQDALKALTSYDSEEIFLAQASRGTLKRTLWQQLLAFKRNKFLLGAGTITSANADTEILDTGLVFGACYVVYDVREIDGYQLLKLRNPPGDHAEWKGDWSDRSRLWTRRLKKLLAFNADADDNTFWMSFDDFCHAFRSLYVCRYHDPARWPLLVRHGRWAGATAVGLPTRHNPGCELDHNPQYTLQVTRPTELLLTVTQVDAAGLAPVDVLPIAVYIVAQGAARDRAFRVKRLVQEEVVAHSGEPVRQRELQLRCELPARAYTILLAAYKKGMEGPFKLTVQTNYPVEVEQLWPALWKDPKTAAGVAGKVAGKMMETMNESSAMTKLLEKKNELVNKLAAGAAVVDSLMRDEEAALQQELLQQKEEEEQAKKGKGNARKDGGGAAKKSPWIEQWDDGAGKPFYFNRATGVSSWEKPADF